MPDTTYSIRCPYCLLEKTVAKDINVNEQLTCGVCKRRFEFQNSLPADKNPDAETNLVLEFDLDTARIRWLARIGIPAMLLCLAILSAYAELLAGPGFLLLYASMGLASLAAATIVRWTYVDTYWASSIAATFFVLLGLIRFFQKSDTDMQNWTGLWLLMAFGTVTYFLRTTASGSSRLAFFGSCGGCGSGSDGGCGGGCGGCG